MGKKQRAASRSSLPWIALPSPGRARTSLLVERVESQSARFGVGANARWVDANHCIFLSAEAANAGLVDRKRHRHSDVAYVDAGDCSARTSRELVTALTAASR